MNLELKFKKSQEVSYAKEIFVLLENAFNDKLIAQNTKTAFFNGYLSKHPNFVIIEKNGKPVAVAVVSTRNIRYFNTIAKAMTVGPFAVKNEMQNRGIGRKLMEGIESLGKKLSVDLLYLVGIKGYYKALGFKTAMQRSKLSILTNELPRCRNVSIQNFKKNYTANIKSCFQDLSCLSNYSSVRNVEDWEWLLEYATGSYYFFKPKVVLNQLGHFVGYFTHDPVEPCRLREAAYLLAENEIESFLAGLGHYSESQKLNELEIMTYPNSPLHCYCKKYLNFSFVKIHNNDGGQMLKELNPSLARHSKINSLHPPFIFQGDNF